MIPRFETLEGFAQKDWYFIRTAQWMVMDNTTITVAGFIEYMSGKYSGKIPEILDKTIIDELLTLVDYKIIQLSKVKGRPDARFDEPGKPGR